MSVAAIMSSLVLVAVASSASAAEKDVNAASHALVQSINIAWRASDAAALARNFAPDGDLITPDGIVSKGSAEIEAFYASAFARGYAGSIAGGQIESVHLISNTEAVIDTTWSITGAHTTKGADRPAEKGILVAVLGYRSGSWKILAMRESASATQFTPLASISQK